MPTPQAGHIQIPAVTTRTGRVAPTTRTGRPATMAGLLMAPPRAGHTAKTTPAGQLAPPARTGRLATAAGQAAMAAGRLVAPAPAGHSVRITPAGRLAAITPTGRVAADPPCSDGNLPRCTMTSTDGQRRRQRPRPRSGSRLETGPTRHNSGPTSRPRRRHTTTLRPATAGSRSSSRMGASGGCPRPQLMSQPGCLTPSGGIPGDSRAAALSICPNGSCRMPRAEPPISGRRRWTMPTRYARPPSARPRR